MISEQMELKKKRKKKKHSSHIQDNLPAQGAGNADPPATEGAEANRFKLGDDFAESSAICTLPITEANSQLCLIQLPLTWEAEAEGMIQLPRDSTSDAGQCSTSAGHEYHVLEEQPGTSAQVFAFSPGSGTRPQAVQRYFTLVKAGNLDLSQLIPPEKAAAKVKSPSAKVTERVIFDTLWSKRYLQMSSLRMLDFPFQTRQEHKDVNRMTCIVQIRDKVPQRLVKACQSMSRLCSDLRNDSGVISTRMTVQTKIKSEEAPTKLPKKDRKEKRTMRDSEVSKEASVKKKHKKASNQQ